MNENIKWNELVIGDKQAETLAYCIYEDIDSYVEENAGRFLIWLIDKDLKNQFIVLTIDGIEIFDNFEYEMCNYFNRKYRG